jgi:hypothetical protein
MSDWDFLHDMHNNGYSRSRSLMPLVVGITLGNGSLYKRKNCRHCTHMMILSWL